MSLLARIFSSRKKDTKMKRKPLLTFSVVVLLFGIGVFAKQSGMLERFVKTEQIVHSQTSQSDLTPVTKPTVDSEQPITDEVAFDMFFIKVVSLERTAAKAEAKGESGKVWRNYLVRNGFSSYEAEMISNTAREHAAEIAPLHARAVQIIKQTRASIASGKQAPLTPPEKLTQLQNQREAITLRNKDRLRNRLGSETIEKIRHLMRSNSISVPVDESELMNLDERIRIFNQKMVERKMRQEGGPQK